MSIKTITGSVGSMVVKAAAAAVPRGRNYTVSKLVGRAFRELHERNNTVPKTPQFHGTTTDRFPFKAGDVFKVNDDGLFIADEKNAKAYALGTNKSSLREGNSNNGKPVIVQIRLADLDAKENKSIEPSVGVTKEDIEFVPVGSGWHRIRPGLKLTVVAIQDVSKTSIPSKF